MALAPFASKMFFADEYFSENLFEKDAFLGVRCTNGQVFRRMVVGNFHTKLGHLEVTHSFAKQYTEDHCPIGKNKNQPNSFLAMYTANGIDLAARVFPTNCDGNFSVKRRIQPNQSVSLVNEATNPKTDYLTKNAYGWINMPPDTKMLVLELFGKVPSRFNTNFRYTCTNTTSEFSTDIATGAKSTVYPPKYSHWGSALIGGGYDFILLIRNNRHDKSTHESQGYLEFFGLEGALSLPINIKPESSTAVRFSEIANMSKELASSSPKLITWFMKLDQPDSETFWLSFRDEDGCILGEHGF